MSELYPDEGYTKMKVADLREAIRNRGLEKKAKGFSKMPKAKLITILEDDDQHNRRPSPPPRPAPTRKEKPIIVKLPVVKDQAYFTAWRKRIDELEGEERRKQENEFIYELRIVKRRKGGGKF